MKPTDEFQAKATLDYGSFETLRTRGHLSGPLSNSVGARIAWITENSNEGWQESVSRDETFGEVDRLAVRGTLDWQRTVQFNATLLLNQWRDKSDTQAPQAVSYAPETPGFEIALEDLTRSIILNGNNQNADWTPLGTPGVQLTSAPRPPHEADGEFVSLALYIAYDISEDLSLYYTTSIGSVERSDVNDVNGIPFEALSYAPRDAESLSQEIRFSGLGVG